MSTDGRKVPVLPENNVKISDNKRTDKFDSSSLRRIDINEMNGNSSSPASRDDLNDKIDNIVNGGSKSVSRNSNSVSSTDTNDTIDDIMNRSDMSDLNGKSSIPASLADMNDMIDNIMSGVGNFVNRTNATDKNGKSSSLNGINDFVNHTDMNDMKIINKSVSHTNKSDMRAGSISCIYTTYKNGIRKSVCSTHTRYGVIITTIYAHMNRNSSRANMNDTNSDNSSVSRNDETDIDDVNDGGAFINRTEMNGVSSSMNSTAMKSANKTEMKIGTTICTKSRNSSRYVILQCRTKTSRGESIKETLIDLKRNSTRTDVNGDNGSVNRNSKTDMNSGSIPRSLTDIDDIKHGSSKSVSRNDTADVNRSDANDMKSANNSVSRTNTTDKYGNIVRCTHTTDNNGIRTSVCHTHTRKGVIRTETHTDMSNINAAIIPDVNVTNYMKGNFVHKVVRDIMFHAVRVSDAGHYYCRAYNTIGSDESMAYLNVRCKKV